MIHFPKVALASNNYDWHLPETDIRDVGEIVTCDIEHLLEAVDSSSAQADLYFRGFDYAMNGKKSSPKAELSLVMRKCSNSYNKLAQN